MDKITMRWTNNNW